MDGLIGRKLAGFVPAPRHASLRKGEGQENADGIERDQAGHAGPEEYDQERSNQRQRDDAAREDQPAAFEGQLAGQEAIRCDQSAQPREIGKRGVGCHDQDQRGRGDDQQIHHTLSWGKRCEPTAR